VVMLTLDYLAHLNTRNTNREMIDPSSMLEVLRRR
jgi:hypothetical protein